MKRGNTNLTTNLLNHISLPPVESNCDNLTRAASSLLLCVCLMQSLLCWASCSPLASLLPPLPPALIQHRVSDLLSSCSQPPPLLDSQQPKGSFPCGVFADTTSNPSFLLCLPPLWVWSFWVSILSSTQRPVYPTFSLPSTNLQLKNLFWHRG